MLLVPLKEANPSVCNKFRQTPTPPKLFPFSWHCFDELFSPLFLFSEDDKVGTLDVLLSSAYCRSQRFLSKQLAQLRPELTMSMFSGKLKLVFFFSEPHKRRTNENVLLLHLMVFHCRNHTSLSNSSGGCTYVIAAMPATMAAQHGTCGNHSTPRHSAVVYNGMSTISNI